MFFLQAFQIDVDHWRHVYMLLGMVWGLEAARVTWLASTHVPQPPSSSRRFGLA
jgi:predicted metal-dependent enzyme (double-stranded beta helix superfamily)